MTRMLIKGSGRFDY